MFFVFNLVLGHLNSIFTDIRANFKLCFSRKFLCAVFGKYLFNVTNKNVTWLSWVFQVSNKRSIFIAHFKHTQLTFTCSKSTIETVIDAILMFLLLTLNIFHTLSISSIVDFEQVNVSSSSSSIVRFNSLKVITDIPLYYIDILYNNYILLICFFY